MVHATGFHGRVWDQVIHHLPGRHVIAVEQRGHGRSSGTGFDSWADFGRDQAAHGGGVGSARRGGHRPQHGRACAGAGRRLRARSLPPAGADRSGDLGAGRLPPAAGAPGHAAPGGMAQEPVRVGAGDVRALRRPAALFGVRHPGLDGLLPARPEAGRRWPRLPAGLRAGLRRAGLSGGAAERRHLRQHPRAADPRAGGARAAAGPERQTLGRAGHAHLAAAGAGVPLSAATCS